MIDLDRPLGVRVFEGAVVCPTLRAPDRPGRLMSGVFEADGTFVEGSVLDHRSGEQGEEIPKDRVGEVEDFGHPEGIFCGVLFNHFGHFLLESSARLWYAAEHSDIPLVWAGDSIWNRTNHRRSGMREHARPTPDDWEPDVVLSRWQREIIEVLGLPNPVMVVTAPTRFGTLHVPDIGYRYDDQFHPQHAAFMARYRGPRRELGNRLWLSRSRIRKDVRDLNEATLERRLAEAGWIIAHPEAQSVREQLDQFSRASIVAGEEGSSFHVLMLMADPIEQELTILRRHEREHRNMHTVGNARHVKQTFVTLRRSIVLRAVGREVTTISPSPAEVLNMLRVPIAPPRPKTDEQVRAETVRAERLTRLAEAVGAATVLFLGTPDGPGEASLPGLRHRVVSARLMCDPRSIERDTVEVFEVPVDQYFAAFTDRTCYDIVRIGPDAGEVPTEVGVVTAFAGSQRNAGQTTVWLIDDVRPPEDDEPPGAGWSALLRILDAFPWTDARTITSGVESQAIVWTRPRGAYRRVGRAVDLPQVATAVVERVAPVLEPSRDEAGVITEVATSIAAARRVDEAAARAEHRAHRAARRAHRAVRKARRAEQLGRSSAAPWSRA